MSGLLLSEAQAVTEASMVLSTLGVRSEPCLLRRGNHLMLRAGSLVVRLAARGQSTHASLNRELQLAVHLAAEGVPVIRVAHPHVLKTPGALATVWYYETHEPGVRPEPRQFAHLLKAFHRVQARTDASPPPFSRLANIARRLQTLRGPLTQADHERLTAAYRQLELSLAEPLPSELGYGLVHGDAHTGNVLISAARGPLLCDFESACLGPREWDLVPTAVQGLRFGHPRFQEMFAHAYGFDVTRWSGWPAACGLRLLSATTWCLCVHGVEHPESQRRLAYWREDDDAPLWSER